ncbi:MAG: sulfotransferase [Candidatus Paceibacterota bacterium]
MVSSSLKTDSNSIHLIYGPRKGGTTLLQRLIDSELVFCHPTETKLKFYSQLQNQVNADKQTGNFTFDNYKKYFRIKYQDVIDFDQIRYEEIIISGLAGIGSLKEYVLLHLYATIEASNVIEVNNRKLFIKDVGGNTKYIFENFLGGFPSGKIVSIRRNPKWVTRAVFKDRTRRSINLNLSQKIAEIIEPIKVDKTQKKYLNNPNILTINYEELTEHTHDIMKKVMTFFDVKFSENNVFPTINGERTVVITSSRNTDQVFTKKGVKLSDDISTTDNLLIHLGPLFYYAEILIEWLPAILMKGFKRLQAFNKSLK